MVTSSRRCPRCGLSLSLLDRYCSACGTRVSRPCPRCEHDVPTDLPFCNYCGQLLAPMDTPEPLSRTDQVSLLFQTEKRAFEDKLLELRRRLNRVRRMALLKRGIELAVFLCVLAVVAIWGAPFLEDKWNALLSGSPARGLVLSFLFSVLVVLLVGYGMQVRQSGDNQRMDELRARLILAQERLEDTRDREQAWKVKNPSEAASAVTADAPAAQAARE